VARLSSLVEREKVAKVLYAESPPEFDFPWDRATDEDRKPYYEAADSVLAALNYEGVIAALRELAEAGDQTDEWEAINRAKEFLARLATGRAAPQAEIGSHIKREVLIRAATDWVEAVLEHGDPAMRSGARDFAAVVDDVLAQRPPGAVGR
jgi:hypothetical protein